MNKSIAHPLARVHGVRQAAGPCEAGCATTAAGTTAPSKEESQRSEISHLNLSLFR